VGHNLFSGAVRDLHGTGHLFLAQFLDVIVADGVQDTASSHEFDPIGAEFNVAAYRRAHVVNGVGNIGLMRQGPVRREHIDVPVAAGYRDKISR
jgi:hypothetical protein